MLFRSKTFCMALGKYLAENKISSVLVELNNSGDFDEMRKYLDDLGEVKIQNKNRFEANDLIFYSNASDSGEIPRKGIDVIILDLGQLNSERKINQLNHADVRLVLFPCVPWKYSLFFECNESIKSLTKSEWIYLANISQGCERQKLRKLMGRNGLVFYSSVINLFDLSSEEKKSIGIVFEKICKLSGRW